MKNIDRWGVGPKFTVISVGVAVLVVLIHYMLFPEMIFIIWSKFINIVLGAVLILIGLVIFVRPARYIDEYYNDGMLCTTGIYSYMRHPIYGAWILFIVPGIVIIIGSIIGLIIPLIIYGIFRWLIPREEKYLEDKFGKEYKEYKNNVNAIIPTMPRRNKK
jgi:protein-S-isoprenylcysteine O-methyltransferase Ste14